MGGEQSIQQPTCPTPLHDRRTAGPLCRSHVCRRASRVTGFRLLHTTSSSRPLRCYQVSSACCKRALSLCGLSRAKSQAANAQGRFRSSLFFAEHMHVYTEQCKRALSTTVNNKLLPRRDQLFTQMARLKARMDEVRAVKANVELDTKAEFTSVRAQPPEQLGGDER